MRRQVWSLPRTCFGDSDIGRWLSVDPLADKYPGWSPYNYTLNNPLKYIDPDGMDVDDFGLNRKTGEVTLLNETSDDYDVLYSQDKKNSIKVDKGVLNDNKEINKGTYYSVKGDKKATQLFEFAANNSNVEWSQVQFGNGSNFISTSGKPHSESSGGNLVYKLLLENETIRSKIHSHPTSTSGPSGFSSQSTTSGDKNFAVWLNREFPKSNIELKVFEVQTQKYIKYNHSGIIR